MYNKFISVEFILYNTLFSSGFILIPEEKVYFSGIIYVEGIVYLNP